MELVNRTAVPAEATVTTGSDPEGPRVGLLTAKATFRLGEDGPDLDTQDPFPLFEEDEETDLGLLPSDALPRRDPAFEVILLGAAYPPGGEAARSAAVRLTVGSRSRSLAVFGDRWWDAGASATEPEPFDRMPLTWDRAFGGSVDAWFDEDTVVEVDDPVNPLGKGFDPWPPARRMAGALDSPESYPRIAHRRPLPNLESPDARIGSPEDDPEPACWATVPMEIGFSQIRTLREVRDHGEVRDREAAEIRTYHRAHPDWILDLPAAGAPVRMEGLSPDGTIAFPLPGLRVLADYVVGERTGSRELRPQMLVLLPEEGAFYLVYRTAFTVDPGPRTERSFRLRLEDGWFEPDAGDAGSAR